MAKGGSHERRLVHAAGVLAVVIGCGLAVWAIVRAMGNSPPAAPLTAALLFAGFFEVLLGAGLLKMSRAAWAFSLSLNGVLGVVGLLALPAVGGTPSVKIVVALALAAIVGVVSLLITAKDEFAR